MTGMLDYKNERESMLDVASMKQKDSQKKQQNASLSTHCHSGRAHHVYGVSPGGRGSSQNGIAQSLPSSFLHFIHNSYCLQINARGCGG
jgi:hypothetical protein